MDLLKKGDLVGISSTARKVSQVEMQNAISILENWGLKVVLSDSLFAEENQYAGSDLARAANFQKFLDDPKIKAIFCARGGYGTVRMVDGLNFDLFLENPKWVVGYSDITVLHAHIYKKTGYSSLHGPMPINWQKEKLHQESLDFLHKTLFVGTQEISFPKHVLNQREEDVDGTIMGGNLSVLYSILGSASDLNYDGKILFLEDLDEYLYHIDRMMIGLKRAGKLAKLEALVIGDMSDMKDHTVPFGKTAYEIIADAVKEYSYPVVFGAPCGHEPRNLSIVMGTRYQLKFGEKVTLSSNT
jgi:muramoyltetrapeptide carboxypeptidase